MSVFHKNSRFISFIKRIDTQPCIVNENENMRDGWSSLCSMGGGCSSAPLVIHLWMSYVICILVFWRGGGENDVRFSLAFQVIFVPRKVSSFQVWLVDSCAKLWSFVYFFKTFSLIKIWCFLPVLWALLRETQISAHNPKEESVEVVHHWGELEVMTSVRHADTIRTRGIPDLIIAVRHPVPEFALCTVLLFSWETHE